MGIRIMEEEEVIRKREDAYVEGKGMEMVMKDPNEALMRCEEKAVKSMKPLVKAGSRKGKVKTSVDQFPAQKRLFIKLAMEEDIPLYEAYFRAGYLKNRDHKSSAVRRQATTEAYRILHSPVVRDYLLSHATTDELVVMGEIDEKPLVDRLMLIAMGNIQQKTIGKGGSEVHIPPTFKDQIEAIKVLFKVKEMRDTKSGGHADRTKLMSTRIDELTREIYTEDIDASDQ